MVMKKYNVKNAFLGVLAILTYFILPMLEGVPFELMGIDTATLPLVAKVIYMVAFETVLMAIIVLIFHKKIEKDWQDMKQNHMNYYSTYLKYWLIAIMVMMLSNLLIMNFTNNGVASNEQTIQELFDVSPIYIFFSAVIFAPVVEELVFRQGIRNIIPNNLLFILASGIIFGGLHVISGSMESLTELLYLIPYCAPGIAFAYILSKTDNIFVSMGIHFMHNGILIALQFMLLFFS